MIEIYIPSLESRAEESSGKQRTVFKVEVLFNGRKHFVLKRHNDFHVLHKKLRKLMKTPDFPSKRSPHWRQKPLDQRRQELEEYLQDILQYKDEAPKEIWEFLHLKHLPLMNKPCRTDVYPSHQHVIGFSKDPYILTSTSGSLPNIIEDGILGGFYTQENPCLCIFDYTKKYSAKSV
ncbi:sorting nexin-22 [Polypterus senegalus]|uniref:sorting nexin-22 n=1 Tax=Polypterus senegalus TaxID=55291 RepID=UPI00196676BD|nr:sorting nexin-22 [Polypterus senegalus]